MSKASYLVIVESPTKARTISKFLGKEYHVESSLGHVRDLPKSELGVDVEHDFAPRYVIPTRSRKQVTKLKKLAKGVGHVYFATDEDREGEAISWHLQEIIGIPESKADRIVFHEITKAAIADALDHPRKIDPQLVDAQQARRVLDRLVGYTLSPFLWRKVVKGLSAGRVQSVAVRLIVEREREIQKFVAQDYWTIELGTVPRTGSEQLIRARLYSIGGKVLDKFALSSHEQAAAVLAVLADASYTISDVTKKEVRKSAPAPYTTSSLQQDANRRLKFSTKQTMVLAQQLYEGIEMGEGSEGLITYMRTDSVSLSREFTSDAQEFITKEYGVSYATGVRVYQTKSKLAQEAHEAIRPTSPERTPERVRAALTDQQYKLYDLIWRRALASQFPDALFEATTIDILAEGGGGSDRHIFRANGQICVFDGFLRVYPSESEETLFPAIGAGAELVCQSLESIQHTTKPPARYSEAGLVKALEEHGIGRPSTYAPTISTIIERNYVQKEDRRLKPTEIAFLVNDLLVEHFGQIVDYAFTARMEDDLDAVATGEKKLVPVLREFYNEFSANLTKKDQELSKEQIAVQATDETCDKCSKPMVIRLGRFGKFLACSGFPECKYTKAILKEASIDTPREGELGVDKDGVFDTHTMVLPCEKCSSPMTLKMGRFGKFYGCSGYPECKNIRNIKSDAPNMACSECHEGSVVQRRSKRGRVFYGCSRYPDCSFVSWTRPQVPQSQEAAPAS